jgi:hypothetical protein
LQKVRFKAVGLLFTFERSRCDAHQLSPQHNRLATLALKVRLITHFARSVQPIDGKAIAARNKVADAIARVQVRLGIL